jgi:hypothetical protein
MHAEHGNVSLRFAVNYLSEELFSKFDDGKKSPAKRAAAVRKFEEAERNCALTNFKFQPTQAGQPPAWLDHDHPLNGCHDDAAVFAKARSIVSRILGPFPGWEAVAECSDFGPGATTRLRRSEAHRSNKWSGKPHAGPFTSSPLASIYDAFPLLMQWVDSGSNIQMVVGNKLDWVPKNYKVDRTIAIEPDLSMFLQKGIGRLIRRRLKRVGQDLDNQETNGWCAAIGSITGELATLDLSAASDSVAYRLCEYLIRPDWFEALVQLRSPVGFFADHDGSPRAVVYEKLSSMGNGYTFEVETLIFYALLRAVSELVGESDHRLYVYGDDLIIPSGMAEVAMTYLKKAGFLVNPDKSYWTGPFRESCGQHFFRGDDVTPFYVREPVNRLDRLFLLHNNCWRWFNKHPGCASSEDIRSFLTWLRSHAPEKWQKPRLTSSSVGDGAFIGNFDEVTPQSIGKSRKRAGWEGWRADVLSYRPRPGSALSKERKRDRSRYVRHILGQDFDPDGSVLASLWSMRQVDPFDPYVSTGRHLRDWYRDLSRPSNTPYAERHWYVGVQVLPWTPEASWF